MIEEILFEMEFKETDEDFPLEFEEATSTVYTTLDHNKLYNRDELNQHNIKAISGLREELDNKQASMSEMSNMDILSLWNKSF